MLYFNKTINKIVRNQNALNSKTNFVIILHRHRKLLRLPIICFDFVKFYENICL